MKNKYYETYYRIPHDYIDIIDMKPPERYVGKGIKGDEEELNFFIGEVLFRFKDNNKPEAKFEEYWRYKNIAMQNTCILKILDLLNKENINFWKISNLRLCLKFYSSKNKSWCKIYDYKIISDDEFGNRFGKEFGNFFGNIKNKIKKKEKELDSALEFVKEKVKELAKEKESVNDIELDSEIVKENELDFDKELIEELESISNKEMDEEDKK